MGLFTLVFPTWQEFFRDFSIHWKKAFIKFVFMKILKLGHFFGVWPRMTKRYWKQRFSSLFVYRYILRSFRLWSQMIKKCPPTIMYLCQFNVHAKYIRHRLEKWGYISMYWFQCVCRAIVTACLHVCPTFKDLLSCLFSPGGWQHVCFDGSCQHTHVWMLLDCEIILIKTRL